MHAPPLPPPPSPVSIQAATRPLREVDVFVDNFIGVAQGIKRQLCNLRRNLLHAIDQVLDSPRKGKTKRNEAASIKKLLQGDSSWATRKLILGWIIDTLHQTLELPPHRKLALAEIFTSLAATSRVTAKKWQSILGKL